MKNLHFPSKCLATKCLRPSPLPIGGLETSYAVAAEGQRAVAAPPFPNRAKPRFLNTSCAFARSPGKSAGCAIQMITSPCFLEARARALRRMNQGAGAFRQIRMRQVGGFAAPIRAETLRGARRSRLTIVGSRSHRGCCLRPQRRQPQPQIRGRSLPPELLDFLAAKGLEANAALARSRAFVRQP